MKNSPIEWTSGAEENLLDIIDFIADQNHSAALKVARAIRRQVEALQTTPSLGRPGRVPDTRELVVTGTSFIVIYSIKAGAVQILRVLHGEQRWPQ